LLRNFEGGIIVPLKATVTWKSWCPSNQHLAWGFSSGVRRSTADVQVVDI